MNDADKNKIENAMMVITSLEGQLDNLLKRGPIAAKAWAADYARSTKPEVKQKLKGQIIPGIAKLMKDAKTVEKDLGNLYKEGSNTKKLAAYPTGKDFRTKTAKYLASSRAFDDSGAKFFIALMNVLGDNMYPSMNIVDVKVTVDSLTNFTSYLNAMKIELNKLT